MDIRTVTVVGAGTMGNGIAHVFALHGFEVILVDMKQEYLDRAMATIGKNLVRQMEKGKISGEQKGAALRRISPSLDMKAAAGRSHLIVEAVSENAAMKKEIFRTLDAVAPPAIIFATNTSSISITALASCTKRPDRVIGMHFMNPVPVMQLVEVIRGHATSDETVQVVKALCTQLEKVAVEAQDYPGFVSNRILMPMINEAIFCVMEGVASAEAIDSVMKLGMNHPMGPLTLADFIGLDVCLDIMNVLHEGIGDPKYRPCPLLKRMVSAGHLGRKSGRGFYTYP